MVPTRREALALGATAGGALLAGCGQESTDSGLVYGFYLVNETDQPVDVTAVARDADGEPIYEGETEVSTNDPESIGEFDTEPAEVHVEVNYSLHGDDPNSMTEAYEAPDGDCSRRVSNKVVVRVDSLSYGTMCDDY